MPPSQGIHPYVRTNDPNSRRGREVGERVLGTWRMKRLMDERLMHTWLRLGSAQERRGRLFPPAACCQLLQLLASPCLDAAPLHLRTNLCVR
jgi:hypothetical protein